MNESPSIVYVLNNTFKSNEYVPPHSHTCFELVFYNLSEVKVKYSKNNKEANASFDYSASLRKPKTLTLKENHFFIIPPNVAHDEFHKGNNEVMCIGFNFDKPSELLPFCFKEISDDKVGIKLLLEQICDEFSKKKFGYQQYMNNLLNNLLLNLFRSVKQERNKNDEFLYIEQYIKQNIGRNLTISSLAEMSGYSLSHFRKLFIEYVGISPKQYITKQRAKIAKRLINNTDLSLAEVGESIGFTDYFQFVSFYKKECGISPGKDRNSTSKAKQ